MEIISLPWSWMNRQLMQRCQCSWSKSIPSSVLDAPIQSVLVYLHLLLRPNQWHTLRARNPTLWPNLRRAFLTMEKRNYAKAKNSCKFSKSIKIMINYHQMTYVSGSLSALSAWPGTSMWMKHERSFISIMHGLFTNSWNDVSNGISWKVFSLKKKKKIAHGIDCQMKQVNSMDKLSQITYDCSQDRGPSWKQLVSLVAINRPVAQFKKKKKFILIIEWIQNCIKSIGSTTNC